MRRPPLNFELIGVDEIDSELVLEFVGDVGEAAADERDFVAEFFQDADEIFRARSELDGFEDRFRDPQGSCP